MICSHQSCRMMRTAPQCGRSDDKLWADRAAAQPTRPFPQHRRGAGGLPSVASRMVPTANTRAKHGHGLYHSEQAMTENFLGLFSAATDVIRLDAGQVLFERGIKVTECS